MMYTVELEESAVRRPAMQSFLYAGQLGVLVVLYFATAKMSLSLAIPPGYATAVWPPAGLALAALLLVGNRLWPGIWLGAAAVNFTVQGSTVSAALIGTGNTLEALVGAALLRSYIGVPRTFDRSEQVFKFVALAAAASTVAATFGVASIAIEGESTWSSLATNWWTWWQGDISAIIVITPLLLCWTDRAAPRWPVRKKIEALVVTFALAVVGYGVFGSSGATRDFHALPFVTLPIIVWAAFRFDQRGVTAAITALCALAIAYTVFGQGPFSSGSTNVSLLLLLAFICAVAMTGLVISAIVGELRRALEALRCSHDELEQRVASRTQELEAANRSLQEEIRRIEMLERSERRINEFLAMLGHELRNPLAPIRNALDLMRIRSVGDSTHEWSRNIIDRQVMQLTRLVDDLLDVGRITSGKIVLRKEPVEMNAAVLRAVESCQPQIDARRHTLELLLSREPLLVDGDLVRLSQIVLNLLNNAVKYTPDGGKIQIALEHEGDCALVRVKDTGIGMSASLIPVAFDLFVQEKHSLSRTEGGLGVGLTVVRHLVQMHGGSVTARSGGAGMGSEFVVRLPMLTLKLKAREPDSNWQPKSPPAKRRILIVDDNHDSADSLASLLSAAGHEVRTRYDGPAVSSAAEEFQPHLVLLDIGLPKMNGYEVARQLRNSAKLRNAVLVAFTGYGTDDDRQQAREAGFDYHLVKPLEPEALERIIDSTPG